LDCFLEFCVLAMGFSSLDLIEPGGMPGSVLRTEINQGPLGPRSLSERDVVSIMRRSDGDGDLFLFAENGTLTPSCFLPAEKRLRYALPRGASLDGDSHRLCGSFADSDGVR
jgi:hypothetical protein